VHISAANGVKIVHFLNLRVGRGPPGPPLSSAPNCLGSHAAHVRGCNGGARHKEITHLGPLIYLYSLFRTCIMQCMRSPHHVVGFVGTVTPWAVRPVCRAYDACGVLGDWDRRQPHLAVKEVDMCCPRYYCHS
jgi:hypothetical protein